MKDILWSALVLGVSLCAVSVGAQPPSGALAIDERQGDQYGWAVDYETAAAAWAAALRECDAGCSVVLTFERCAAYAADQDADSTAVGWAQSYASADGARQAALAECSSRGGSGCVVRVWGCNGPVVEEGLGLDRAARRQIQQRLEAGGFDPGSADGLFGPRTRAAIRNWQASRGGRATGYLDDTAVAALRLAGGSQPAVAAAQPPSSSDAQSEGLEGLFWQSIMTSANPADFEAYLEQFPNGMFRALAENRLSALRGPAGGSPAAAGAGPGRVGTPASESRASGTPAPAAGIAAAGDTRPRPGAEFRSDETCAGQLAGTACWKEVFGQPGCYVWDSSLVLGQTVTWTGECTGGLAQGTGTLTWASDGNQQTSTGRLQDGQGTGNWVIRFENGDVYEGPFVDGQLNGHWVLRWASGTIGEGPIVDGQQNGHWVIRFENGTVEEGPYVDGQQNGHWVRRSASGDASEGSYVDGKRNGHWVERIVFEFLGGGQIEEGPYVDGERNGHWVRRDESGRVEEGSYVDNKRDGHWVIRNPNGDSFEGPYVDGEQNGHWIYRFANGVVEEGSQSPYELLFGGGRVWGRQGHWIVRYPNGAVEDVQFVNGDEVSRRLR